MELRVYLSGSRQHSGVSREVPALQGAVEHQLPGTTSTSVHITFGGTYTGNTYSSGGTSTSQIGDTATTIVSMIEGYVCDTGTNTQSMFMPSGLFGSTTVASTSIILPGQTTSAANNLLAGHYLAVVRFYVP